MNQIVRDWKAHPITANFFEEAAQIRNRLNEHLINGGAIGDVAETARLIGFIQGLDALLEYDPPVDEDGVIIDES